MERQAIVDELDNILRTLEGYTETVHRKWFCVPPSRKRGIMQVWRLRMLLVEEMEGVPTKRETFLREFGDRTLTK